MSEEKTVVLSKEEIERIKKETEQAAQDEPGDADEADDGQNPPSA
ncbi:MAG: hypothetical protein KatS3mg121_1318 [Gammaproteobacteria bacterium]|nr:MAG: hypothetical protein KatS3mg121_1318 [Gammaproteobacteria bacterium]